MTLPTDNILLVVAAPKEAQALWDGVGQPAMQTDHLRAHKVGPRICGGQGWILETGVGKAAAAASLAHVLSTRFYQGSLAVVNVGLAGSYVQLGSHAPIGSWVIADRSMLADEGFRGPDDSFVSIDQLGFGPTEFAAEARMVEWMRSVLPQGRVGPITTVSTCSGNDMLAKDLASRTGACAEAMEGGACALVCARLGVSFVEARVISNRTGDRNKQGWDLNSALARLREFAAQLIS